MKRLMMVMAIAVSVVLFSGSAWAGPVDGSKVSSEAKWLVHVDIQAFLASKLGQHALERAQERGLERVVEMFTEKVGFDPTKDLRSITLWGMDYSSTSGVAVIQGNIDKQKLVDLASQNRAHEEVEYGGYTLHYWRQKPINGKDRGNRWGVVYDDQTVLMARDRKTLEGALDVLKDRDRTLAGGGVEGLDTAVPEGTFLLMAARQFKLPAGRNGMAALAENIDAFRLELGEANEEVFVKVAIHDRDEEEAQQLRVAAEGGIAMAKLMVMQAEEQGSAEPLWAPAAEAAVVGGEGRWVTLRTAVPTEDVLNELVRLEAQRERPLRRVE